MTVRVLVTGGAGFIGSHLVDRLVEMGHYVRVLDNFSTGRVENLAHHGGVEVVKGDLKSPADAWEAVKGVEVVFHFAANPEVRVSTVSPKTHYEENVLATFNLLEAMRESGVRELVFASSSSVYGEPSVIPVSEDYPTAPVSVYGATKAACENLIHAYSQLYGIKSVVLRYANVVGPRLRHGVVYDLLMKLARDRYKLEVLGDGTQTRSYIYIDDAVDATIAAWRKSQERYSVYNVATYDWIDVKTVVNIILTELKIDPEVHYKPVLHGVGWPGDVKKVALDIKKIGGLGFQPKLNSTEAVRKTVQHLVKELNLTFT